MADRFWMKLLLTTSNGAISHTDQNGKAVSAIFIGHLTDVCIHLYDGDADTIKVWGTNEQSPTGITNAVQLGDDLVPDATAMVVLEDGPQFIFIEFDTDDGGDPYAIITGTFK